MNAVLRGGSWDGVVCPGLHGGDQLERTSRGEKHDDRWLLDVYERTDETTTIELTHGEGYRAVVKQHPATIFEYRRTRTVLKDVRHRRLEEQEPEPGEQMALAM